MVKITFPDGSVEDRPDGITPLQIAEGISNSLARKVVAAKVGDEVVDLTRPIAKDASIKLLTFEDKEGKEVFWHSSAHLMAMAVLELYPETKLTIGPPIEDGFYYDFFRETSFTEEDLGKIEKRMAQLRDKKVPFERKEVSVQEARKLAAQNRFKQELIDEYQGEQLTYYHSESFSDLCRGPHLPHTGYIRAFKLLNISTAYWRGDAKGEVLQRIYGTAYPDEKQLKEHLRRLEEAERRNHRRIGREMGIYEHFDLIGRGLPVWLPKGEVLRQQIERYAVEMEDQAGFLRVSTPSIAKKELFERSGHLPYYEHSMYPKMVVDDGTYYLKAMNCPLHHLIYARRPRSYRELPLRLAEYGTCYRNELSGTLNGLLRVRSLRMNDAHIYCTKKQIEAEVTSVLAMIKEYFAVFRIEEYWFRLSLGDVKNTEKYVEDPDAWKLSEDILRKTLTKLKLEFVEAPDEAAFYGPKIDVQFRNVYGREETMSTVQLDFVAKKRFGLTFIDESGKENPDVYVIHRAPLSTHERFMAFLLEHYAGKFPLWLSPEQVRILPIAERHAAYARKVAEQCKKKGLRVSVDNKSLTTAKKVRSAQLARVNYILVVGDQEEKAGTVNVRRRDEEKHSEQKVDAFIKALVKEREKKK